MTSIQWAVLTLSHPCNLSSIWTFYGLFAIKLQNISMSWRVWMVLSPWTSWKNSGLLLDCVWEEWGGGGYFHKLMKRIIHWEDFKEGIATQIIARIDGKWQNSFRCRKCLHSSWIRSFRWKKKSGINTEISNTCIFNLLLRPNFPFSSDV